MPRRLIKKITPSQGALQRRWFLRIFGSRLADPALWSAQRRAVTGAFGAGLAICFVPLPVHLPLCALVAIVWRLNVPTIVGTVFLNNPLTVIPIFYAAYRVGSAVLRLPSQHFVFHFSSEWLQHGLGPAWKPFLLGCLICAVVIGTAGWLGLELLWRWSVTSRYRRRKAASVI